MTWTNGMEGEGQMEGGDTIDSGVVPGVEPSEVGVALDSDEKMIISCLGRGRPSFSRFGFLDWRDELRGFGGSLVSWGPKVQSG